MDLFLLVLEDEPELLEPDLDLLGEEIKEAGIGNLLPPKICRDEREFIEYIRQAKAGKEGCPLPDLMIFDHVIERLSPDGQKVRVEIIPNFVEEVMRLHSLCVRIGFSGMMPEKEGQKFANGGHDHSMDIGKLFRDQILHDFIPKGKPAVFRERFLKAVRQAAELASVVALMADRRG